MVEDLKMPYLNLWSCMTSNKVLITGVTGQDGSLLAKLLTEQGKKVFGTYRKTSSNYLNKITEIGILDSIQLVEYQIGQTMGLVELLRNNKFESIYHLAGESMTSDSFLHPHQTVNTNTQGVIDLLESVNRFSKDSKIFIAGSSEIFDNSTVYSKLSPKMMQKNQEIHMVYQCLLI